MQFNVKPRLKGNKNKINYYYKYFILSCHIYKNKNNRNNNNIFVLIIISTTAPKNNGNFGLTVRLSLFKDQNKTIVFIITRVLIVVY